MEKTMTMKKKVMKCFTCPICTNLFNSATTISECLHTFCRKCINDKIVEENLNACPVCNADLGVAPLEKLRADNTWDDMRLKLFPPKPETVKAAATETNAVSLKSSRKKDNSLSSLFDNSLRMSSSPESSPDEKLEHVPLIQSSSRPFPRLRKNPRPKRNGNRLAMEPSLKGSENDFKILINIDQQNGLAGAEASEGHIQKRNHSTIDNEEIPILVGDQCKPLSGNKRGASEDVYAEKTQECIGVNHKRVLCSGGETEEVRVQLNLNQVFVSSVGDTEEVSGKKLKTNGKENREHVLSTEKNSDEKPKGKQDSHTMLRPRRRKTMMSSSADVVATQDAMEPETKVEGSNNQVWFSLVASQDQNTARPLPQITPGYLRVNNGNSSVSHVKKYLMKKLSLKSEDEVEIWLRDEQVCSRQRLHNLVEWWVHTTPVAERESAMAGSFGAGFIMVLFYSRSH